MTSLLINRKCIIIKNKLNLLILLSQFRLALAVNSKTKTIIPHNDHLPHKSFLCIHISGFVWVVPTISLFSLTNIIREFEII